MMENILLNQVFRKRTLTKPTRINTTFFDFLQDLPYSICPRLCVGKKTMYSLIRKVGLRRIKRELDVAKFIRK
jgi:hypothetical protein